MTSQRNEAPDVGMTEAATEESRENPLHQDADLPDAHDVEGAPEAGAGEEFGASVEPGADELKAALASAEEQLEEMRDNTLRVRAEMENIRRRAQNEVISARKFAIEGFAQELLTVKDSLDQAARVELSSDESDAVVKMQEGLALTLKQLDAALAKFGVNEVEADAGVKFDPEQHQAISMMPSEDVESNHIIDVMQKGFTLKDRLLRPAMVVVAS